MEQENSKPNKILSAVAMVCNSKGKVLISKRASVSTYKDRWVLPGGKVDVGETPEQTVLRELAEEVELIGCNPQLLTTKETLPSKENKFRNYLMYFFRVLLDSKQEPKITDEVAAIAWVGCDDYQNYNIAPKTMEFLREFFNGNYA